MYFFFQVFVYKLPMETSPIQTVRRFHLDVRRPLIAPVIFTNVSCEKYSVDTQLIQFTFEKENTLILRLYFLDSACQELNLKHHCYKFDPHCPTKDNIDTNDIPTTINVLVVYLGLAIVFIAMFCILLFCRQKLRQLIYSKQNDIKLKRYKLNVVYRYTL